MKTPTKKTVIASLAETIADQVVDRRQLEAENRSLVERLYMTQQSEAQRANSCSGHEGRIAELEAMLNQREGLLNSRIAAVAALRTEVESLKTALVTFEPFAGLDHDFVSKAQDRGDKVFGAVRDLWAILGSEISEKEKLERMEDEIAKLINLSGATTPPTKISDLALASEARMRGAMIHSLSNALTNKLNGRASDGNKVTTARQALKVIANQAQALLANVESKGDVFGPGQGITGGPGGCVTKI